MPQQNKEGYNLWSAVSIFLLSVTIISLQLMLMRALSVTYYYHFSYLVISTALLGFGASGTFLSLTYDRLKARFATWITWFYLFFIFSIPASYFLAQQLPVDVRYLLYSGWQVVLLVTYNLLLFIPFFLGAVIIGFMLSYFKKEVPELYGANLAGSGIGGVMAIGVMYMFPSHMLPLKITPIALLALVTWLLSTIQPDRRKKTVFGVAGGVITLFALLIHPSSKIDTYKDLAHFQRLEVQNDATHLASRYGPRSQIDVYESPTIHNTLFAGLQAEIVPPDQLAVLMDGQMSGTVFSIDDPSDAKIMDYTPQSMPYRLKESPDVLLLGEVSGVNVWLAKRFGAQQITVVQTNPQIIELMKNDLSRLNGDIFDMDDVKIVHQHPRLYLEQSDARFDIIQLVTGEGMATGTSGLQGLHEDYVLTEEGIRRSLQRLRPGGLVSVTRGLQSPPRDNIKIFGLFINALRSLDMPKPSKHLLISRNYLAVNSMVSDLPVNQSTVKTFKTEVEKLGMDAEFYPGIDSQQIEQRNEIEGPEDMAYSYLHHALVQMLAGNSESFYSDWAYFVRPPTDNRPYFYDFFKWSTLDRFVESYGRQWFQKLELGYVILVLTFLELAVAAFALILLPLWIKRSGLKQSENKLPTFLHFGAIGIGFMFMEIIFIQLFNKFLGDPIYSTAATLTSILVFSGLGSYLQKRMETPPLSRITTAALIICGIAVVYLLFLNEVLNTMIDLSLTLRFIVTIIALIPISFFMGWMFPSGMQVLENRSEELIPWAWGVNGFASVTAAPLAVMLSMSIGFNWVIVLAACCYLITIPAVRLWR